MYPEHGSKLPRLLCGVNLVLSVSCAAPSAAPSPPAPMDAPALRGPFARSNVPLQALRTLPDHPEPRAAGRLSELEPRRARRSGGETVLDQLTRPVTGARLVEGLGEALTEALEIADEEGANVRRYGPGVLDTSTLFGDDFHEGLCEIPQITYATEHGGESWDITLGVALWENVIGDPELVYGEMSQDCGDALAAQGGDAEAAEDSGECVDLEILMFLPEGSECRTCVEESAGDFWGCQESGACLTEAPMVAAVGDTFWNEAEATVLACAPDYTVPIILLGTYGQEGVMPAPFDLAKWGFICAPFGDPDTGRVSYGCQDGTLYAPDGDTLRVGVAGVVEGMRRAGDDDVYYRHRGYYTPRIELEDGSEIRYAWEAYTSYGVLSTPPQTPDSNGDGVVDASDDDFGNGYYGWGLNPVELRPDGADADVLDDTYARDWYAAMVVKTATTRNGVAIAMSNHSRCAEHGWEDLDGDGVYRCVDMAPPEAGWLSDGNHTWWYKEDGTSYSLPIATLASTGLPDEDIPGGIVPWVAGSPTLADPEWDNCRWDHDFVPDRAPVPDTASDWSGSASLWGDAYRFGAHEDDVRLVLYTNVARDFCPDGFEP